LPLASQYKSIPIGWGWYLYTYQFNARQANTNQDLPLVLVFLHFANQSSRIIAKSSRDWHQEAKYHPWVALLAKVFESQIGTSSFGKKFVDSNPINGISLKTP
jgi:hypothetical protein